MEQQQIVALHGEFDLWRQPELDALLDRIRPGAAGTVIDLHEVTFLDSTFLESLLMLHRRLGETLPAGGVSIVAPRSSSAWRIFTLTDMFRFFRVFEDMAAARVYVADALYDISGPS